MGEKIGAITKIEERHILDGLLNKIETL